MHELGLCEDIVAAVERRANGRAVARFRVQVGRLHHVHPEAFEQSIEMAAAGGPAEGAVAELVLVPVRARCTACGHETESDELIMSCAECGSMDVELCGGEELVLESIEYQGA
jgi:hydrogenase nickel incorporation protein HypA/HybF